MRAYNAANATIDSLAGFKGAVSRQEGGERIGEGRRGVGRKGKGMGKLEQGHQLDKAGPVTH